MADIPLDETVHFDVVTHTTAAVVSDADSTPTYDVLEEATDTPILAAQNFTKRTALTGNYRASFAVTSGSGFEVGKFYIVIASATVGGTAGKCVAYAFRCAAAEAVTGQPVVDVGAVSGDASAADNIEATYDGTGYTDDAAPSTQLQVGNLTSGTAAINTVAESFTKVSSEPETNDYTDTFTEDGVYHEVEDVTGATDCYYQFDVGGTGIPVSIKWVGYAQGNGDTYSIFAWNWGLGSWEQIGTVIGTPTASVVTTIFDLTNGHVGTGANLGKVRFRFQSSDGAKFATDRILCSYAVVPSGLGFVGGAVWIDTNNGESGTTAGIGEITRPSDNIADAKTIAANNNLKIFHWLPNSSDTLASDFEDYEFIGHEYSINLGGRSVSRTLFTDAILRGTGSGTGATFRRCEFSTTTSSGPGIYDTCIFIGSFGTEWTANGAGEYLFIDPNSGVAGSGTPYWDFSGTGGVTGVNIRGLNGGSHITLDSNNTLSLEISEGGGQTIITGGADCEIRGLCRSLTVTMSAAETIQFVGITGPITLSGTTTGTVNLYGIASSLTNTTSAAVVTDNTLGGGISETTLVQYVALIMRKDPEVWADLSAKAALINQDFGTGTGSVGQNDTLENIIDTGSTGPWTSGAGGGGSSEQKVV